MNVDDFRRVLISFADDATDLDLSKGNLLVQIHNELIDATIEESEGELFVTENGERSRAFLWIVNRIARLPTLADRILNHISPESHFVTPTGRLIDHLDDKPDGVEISIKDVPAEMTKLLSRGTAGTSAVLYITSDAGEGKTTLINEIARSQAIRFKKKEASWLLVPISLGGRSFLTFDDIVVAELVNKLRFQLLYYDAFIELVRLRVLVPAFDGFEEMFVEGSSGEALSALGNLMHSLKSSGSVLIAARKAYFEYQNFGTQARLFDAIRGHSVAFARLALDRWDKEQFLLYTEKRGIADCDEIYNKVCTRLGSDHPLLTRAVLVERLVDIAQDGGVDSLLAHLGTNPEDYFYQFVNAIIEREANEKWIDRSGNPHSPLLTTAEHHSLLSMIAKEMWLSSNEVLRGDYLDLVADLFVGDLNKPLQIARQIVSRLRHHSLIAADGILFSFDHEDFRRFYLGEALGGVLLSESESTLTVFLQKSALPSTTADSAMNSVKRNGGDLKKVLASLQSLVKSAVPASYISENAGALASRLLELIDDEFEVVLDRFVFPPDALKGRRLGRVVFNNCQFQGTSLENANIGHCKFDHCEVHRFEWSENFNANGAIIENTNVHCVVTPAEEIGVYDPVNIQRIMTDVGFEVIEIKHKQTELQFRDIQPDNDTLLAEHALRIFMRATQINEDVFQVKFGTRASQFMEDILPRMLELGLLEEVSYKGSGRQRRFKLCVPMRNIDAAIPATVKSLEEFLMSVLT